MKKLLFLTILFPTSLLFAQLPQVPQKAWQQLFNGKDLSGWSVKIRGYDYNDNFGSTFRISNGNLKVAYDSYDKFNERFGHLFYEKKYGYYLIATEYRFVGEQATEGPAWALRNSGIMIHCQPPATMGKNQDFPISIEVQLLGGNGKDPRTTCNLCTPGTHVVMDGNLVKTHCINSTSKTFAGDTWVRAEVLVLGDSLVQHFINGEKVLEYSKPQIGGDVVSGFNPVDKPDGKFLTEGYISLQSESHPIEFRKVEIVNLEGCTDPSATNYKPYFKKSNNSLCTYSIKKKGK
jgi:Domain of Unknown Function (DUF1080)